MNVRVIFAILVFLVKLQNIQNGFNETVLAWLRSLLKNNNQQLGKESRTVT